MSGLMGQLTSDIDALDFDKPIRLSGQVSRFDGHIIECDVFPPRLARFVRLQPKRAKQPMPK